DVANDGLRMRTVGVGDDDVDLRRSIRHDAVADDVLVDDSRAVERERRCLLDRRAWTDGDQARSVGVLRDELLAVHECQPSVRCHAGLLASATRCRASASSAARMAWVARCSRERTVPGGTASTSAASSSEYPR